MELEGRNEIDDNTTYNIFFYATMCHVCKRFGDDVHLKRCGGCGMITYCGKKHQKCHWTQHKSLCKAIQDVLRECSVDNHDVTLEELDKMKMNFMLLVSLKLKRRLKTYEVEMFQFPRECTVCYERNGQLLEDCQKCAVSFCKNHKNDIKHTDMCAPLELCLCFNLLRTRFINYEESISGDLHYLQHISDTATFRNMNDFIKTYGNFLLCKNDGTFSKYNIKAAKHSNYLTRPLTLFHAMQLLNYIPERECLVIHVVGANSSEEVTSIAWEILLHLIRTLSSLVIIMIGPELTLKSYPLYLCNNCVSREKNTLLQFHNILYEDYINNPLFLKPDIVIGFNVGFHAEELNSTAETWARSIQVLAKQNCPFVFTCYTRQELEDDIDRINTILNKRTIGLYSGKNQFAGLRPYRMIGRKKVYYLNRYMAIYRSLCP